MPTVGHEIAKQIAAGDGYYQNDPRVVRIVKYINMGGKEAYGLEYEGQLGKYAESAYVRDPQVYWSAE